MNKKHSPHTDDPKLWGQEEVEEHQSALSGDNVCYFCENDRYDRDVNGNLLEIDVKYAQEERGEALANKFINEKEEQDYIRKVNQENRQKVMENNKAPF